MAYGYYVYLLREYANEEFDLAKAMMALVHDVVEIDAGDTYAYDTEELINANVERGNIIDE